MMADLNVLPCPFCGSEMKHIETWAKSFKPPRLYHEWHHVEATDCPMRDHGGLHKATDDPKDQQWVVRRLNQRAGLGQTPGDTL